MINTLKNPLSDNYKALKQIIFSLDFPWFWSEFSTDNTILPGYSDISIYYHSFLRRPDAGAAPFPEVCSPQLIGLASSVVKEILNANDIQVNTFLRMCANAVHPSALQTKTVPHVDHQFDHKNCLIYLANADGDTIVSGERSSPMEDKVIVFGGEEHYHETPTTSRRVVLVSTFL